MERHDFTESVCAKQKTEYTVAKKVINSLPDINKIRPQKYKKAVKRGKGHLKKINLPG
jgi:hypothetical protein